MFSSPLEVNQKSSVFVLKDARKDHKLERLSGGVLKESYKLRSKGEPEDTEVVMAKKMKEFS